MRLFSVQFRATKEGKATVDRSYEVNPVDSHRADVQFLQHVPLKDLAVRFKTALLNLTTKSTANILFCVNSSVLLLEAWNKRCGT